MSTTASPELENGPTPHLPRKVFKRHTALVRSVGYFKDGKRVVSGSDDKSIQIWDVESEKQEWQSPEQDFMWCMVMSPDERTLAVSGKGRVVLWNLESRSVVWTMQETVNGYCVAFSPDGQLIAATGYSFNDIVLLDAETGEQLREPLQFGETVWCLEFSLDGTQVVAGSNHGKVRVFDVATGKTVLGPINAHTNYVTSSLFTPDGKQIITASEDNSIRVWDRSTGLEVGDPMLGHDRVWQIALSHDGRRLVGVDSATVRVWDWNTRRQLDVSLQAQGEYSFYSIAWSPNGRSIVAGSHEGAICLWDAPPLEGDAGDPPQPSTSRPRSGSLSPSILDLPAGAPPPIKPNSNHPPRRDDFWDTSDIDLPARARTQISTIPIAEVPLKPAIPRTSKAKAAPNISSTSSAGPSSDKNLRGRIGARFRRDKHAPNAIEMQPPPTKMPKYSAVGKVALGQADAVSTSSYTPALFSDQCSRAQRLYMDTSKDKKPGDDESGEEEWADVKVNCWDIFRAMFTSCCSSRSDSG